MLFVALLKKKGNVQETMSHRIEWEYPEGITPVSEYWLQTDDPHIICVYETDSVVPMMDLNTSWAELFDVTVVPAIRAKDGLALVKHMMKK